MHMLSLAEEVHNLQFPDPVSLLQDGQIMLEHFKIYHFDIEISFDKCGYVLG